MTGLLTRRSEELERIMQSIIAVDAVYVVFVVEPFDLEVVLRQGESPLDVEMELSAGQRTSASDGPESARLALVMDRDVQGSVSRWEAGQPSLLSARRRSRHGLALDSIWGPEGVGLES